MTVTAAITQGLAVAAIPAAVATWATFRGIRAWRDRADRRAIRTALADLTNTCSPNRDAVKAELSLDGDGQGPADSRHVRLE